MVYIKFKTRKDLKNSNDNNEVIPNIKNKIEVNIKGK